MKNRVYFTVILLGFIIGILFYGMDLMMNNAEISSVEPKLNELLRNIDFTILFLYGFISAVILFFLTFIIKNLKKQN